MFDSHGPVQAARYMSIVLGLAVGSIVNVPESCTDSVGVVIVIVQLLPLKMYVRVAV